MREHSRKEKEKGKPRLKIIFLALFALSAIVGCRVRVETEMLTKYIPKNPQNGRIYWQVEHPPGTLVPYKYENGSWIKIEDENIVEEVSCVEEAKKYAQEYLTHIGRAKTLTITSFIFLFGILLSPIFAIIGDPNTGLIVGGGSLALFVPTFALGVKEANEAKVNKFDAINSYNIYFEERCKKGGGGE